MPAAERGIPKWLATKMASKGLQRLRWYCQVCERQCRDANGFKCHVQSESHIRQIQTITENPHKAIDRFSRDFQHEFLHLLRTAHGEKYINANRFYGGEFIRDKAHTHMNATRWPSLTEFVKHLGREGLYLVKEDEKDGLCIAWRDTSLAAMKRQQEIEKAEKEEARDCSDERILKKMEQRAKEEAEARHAKISSSTAQEEGLIDDTLTVHTTPEARPVKFSLKSGIKPDDPPSNKRRNVLKRGTERRDENKGVKKLKI